MIAYCLISTKTSHNYEAVKPYHHKDPWGFIWMKFQSVWIGICLVICIWWANCLIWRILFMHQWFKLIFWWLSSWLWYLQCISTGDTTTLHKAINFSAHSFPSSSRNPISIPCPVPLMSPRLVCCHAGFIRAVAVGHKFEKSLTVGYHGLLWDRIKRLRYCLWLIYHLLY